MTRTSSYACIVALLTIIIVIAALGLYVPLAGMMGHDMGCPFSFDGAALCAAPLAHLSHWQIAFASILLELLAIFALLACSFPRIDLGGERDPEHGRYRWHARIPHRPTLFQELFTKGILNRKAP